MAGNLRHLGCIVGLALFIGPASSQAQSLNPGTAGFGGGGGIGGAGVVPLGGLESEVLEQVSVGIPIAPGFSVDYKFAFDRHSANPTLNKSGLSLAFPGADVTIGLTGDVSVTATQPGMADLPNYLIPALMPPAFQKLIPPLKIGGGVSPGSLSFAPRGGQ